MYNEFRNEPPLPITIVDSEAIDVGEKPIVIEPIFESLTCRFMLTGEIILHEILLASILRQLMFPLPIRMLLLYVDAVCNTSVTSKQM